MCGVVWWRSSSLTVNCGSLAWGYGTDDSTDYSRLRTVGATLGEPGFFRLLRAVAVGKCGLLSGSTLLPSGLWQQTVEFLCALGVWRKRGKVTRQLR